MLSEFVPGAVRKDRAETEKFQPVRFQPGVSGKNLRRNRKTFVAAVSCEVNLSWGPRGKTAPKRKIFHRCAFSPVVMGKTAPKPKKISWEQFRAE